MKSKSLLCLILSTLLVLSIVFFPNTISAKEYSYSKISNRLKNDIEQLDSDTTVPVYVFLKNEKQEDVFNYIYDNYGIDANIFEDTNLYFSKVIKNIPIDGSKSLEQVLLDKKAEYKDLKFSSKDSPFSLEYRKMINSKILKTTNHLLKCYRKGFKEINNEYLSSFIDNNKIYIDSIIYKPLYGSFIIANVKLNNLKQLALSDLVTTIDFFDDVEQKCESWNAQQVTKADSVSGIGSIFYNDGLGYDGTDINIGVIEANSGVYDENNYNLTDANITLVNNPSLATYQISNHATKVTSLICGKKTTISGRTYEGAARGANIYQIPSKYASDLYVAIDILVDEYDIDIINYSAGAIDDPGYSILDQAIDNIIVNSKISFVVSAGNQGTTGNVTSPGKAFNAITVGNIKSESNNVALLPPYNVYSSSSSLEAYYLPNKPDIVVPASGLYLPADANSSVYIGSATSWAAPIATGIAAQIMQADPSAIININALKSYLACGANNDLITGTTVSYGSLREESGAGLVDAKESLLITEFGNEIYGAWTSNASAPTQYYDKATLHLYADNRVRIATSFRKAENIPITTYYGNNIDIRLVDTNSDFCVSSESLNNNIELIDTVVPSDGYYKIQMRLTNSILSPGTNDNLRFWMCWNVFY